MNGYGRMKQDTAASDGRHMTMHKASAMVMGTFSSKLLCIRAQRAFVGSSDTNLGLVVQVLPVFQSSGFFENELPSQAKYTFTHMAKSVRKTEKQLVHTKVRMA